MIVFFILFCIGLAAFAAQTWLHIRNIYRGIPGQPADHIGARFRHTMRMAFGQHRLRERWWGKAHVVIFYAFLVFLLGTLELLIQCLSPNWSLTAWTTLGFTATIHLIQTYFAWMTLVAITVVMMRRILRKKEVRSSFDAYFILALIDVLMLSHLAITAARFAMNQEPEWLASLLPLCNALARTYGDHASIIHDIAAAIHILAVAVFLVWIPRGKHLHILFAFPSLFVQFKAYDEHGKPLIGADSPDIEQYESQLEEALEKDLPEDNWPVIGAIQVRDFQRKHLLNAHACAQCQRCTNACPIVAADHTTGPMDAMIRLRTLCKTPNAALIADDGMMNADELWKCTQCGACERACPVGSAHTTRIIDARRGLICREQQPPKCNTVFAHVERSGNPWGYPKSDRMKWTECLKVKENSQLPRILFFAGCMSSYDPEAARVMKKCIEWLQAQGFEVHALNKETCCGEPLRKLGKEDLFAESKKSTLEEIQKVQHDIILTLCPHCADTLRYEYDSGIHALHFVQFMAEMFAQNRLEFTPCKQMPLVHVPCKLGKTPDTPVKMLKFFRALGLKQADQDVSQAHCCGAGGGQFFLDHARTVTRMRVQELVAQKPTQIATACPFCFQMIDDELKLSSADQINQQDMHDNAKEHSIQMANVIEIIIDCVYKVHAENIRLW